MHDVSDLPSNTNSQIHVDKERSELTPLYTNASDTGTLRLIVAFFFGFTLTLTAVLGVQIYYGKSQIVPHGSVTSDDETCSNIGASIMKQGGNAVDSAIAVAFCIGVVNPHITGLASGGFILIYDHRDKKVVDTIDFRVTRSHDSGIGVPGFVAGMYLAHQLYGKLPWRTLVMPAHQISRTGFKVSQTFKDSEIHLLENRPHNSNLKEWLQSLSVNEIIVNNDLAATLLSIANSGQIGNHQSTYLEFYNKTLVDELGNIMEVEDIINYEAKRSTWLNELYENYDVIVPAEGSGGPFLLQNLKLLNDSLSPLLSSIGAYFHVAESWPISTASHVATIDVNDLYVSVVSGLGSMLGSQILTHSGFIMNNILETTLDLNIRPAVLLTPVITIQSGNVCGRRLVLGGGDVRDVAQALVYLWRNPSANVTESIYEPRVRVIPPRIAMEKPSRISNRDYIVLSQFNLTEAPLPYPSINVIQKIKDDIVAVADYRGYGGAVVF